MSQTTERQGFRHEWKHAITPSDADALRRRLSAIMRKDRNGNGRYRVRSLYFDNPYDKALREKLDGLAMREKFRIRCYNGDASYIRLEKKSKLDALCRKDSAPLTNEQCLRLLRGDTDWMKTAEDPLIAELHAKMHYQLLRPRTLVEYTREAYVYPHGNVRVTLDSDIRTGISATALLDPVVPMLPACRDQPIVLEVKYDSYLPDIIRDIVQTPNRRTASFSKYAACRVYG